MSLHWDFAPRLVVLRLVLEASCYHLSTVVRSNQIKSRFAPTRIDHLIRLSTTAAHLGQGFEVVASIRQLLKGPVPENHETVFENCESLATFITSESEDAKVEEAGAKCQERSEKLTWRCDECHESLLSAKRTHDVHMRYVASLSRRILALNREDYLSREGTTAVDEYRQFERFYLIYQLSTGTADLLQMRKKYTKAKKRLEKLESRSEKVNKVFEEQHVALETLCDEESVGEEDDGDDDDDGKSKLDLVVEESK